MYLLEKILATFVAISPIKYLCGTFVYFNIFFPLVGLVQFFRFRNIPFLFYPVIVSCFFNLITCFWHLAPAESYFRVIQLFLIIYGAIYVSFRKNDFLPTLILRVFFPVLVVDFLFFLSFYFFENASHTRNIFGFVVPRYVGLAGDPNFSGMLCAVASMILFSFRKRVNFFVGMVIVFISLFTFSRTVFIVYFVFSLGMLMRRELFKIYCWFLLFLVFLFPVSLLLVDSYVSMDDKIYLTKITSARYPFWVAYCTLGIQSPLGCGYFNSLENALDFIDMDLLLHDDLSGYVNQGLIRKDGVRAVFIEQHSLQLQVLSDFGVVGYLSLWCLIFVLVWALLQSNNKKVLIIISSLVGYTFINAMSEWALWCSIGFSCSLLPLRFSWRDLSFGSVDLYHDS